MKKVTFNGKEFGLWTFTNSISICDIENNNNTKTFAKVLIDEEGNETINPNFKAEVEAFAGEGFLDR